MISSISLALLSEHQHHEFDASASDSWVPVVFPESILSFLLFYAGFLSFLTHVQLLTGSWVFASMFSLLIIDLVPFIDLSSKEV